MLPYSRLLPELQSDNSKCLESVGEREGDREGERSLRTVLSRHEIYKLLHCAIINFSLRKNAKFIYTMQQGWVLSAVKNPL